MTIPDQIRKVRQRQLNLARTVPEVQALVALAKDAEWSDESGPWRCCPWCGGSRSQGHVPDCQYVTVLAPFEKKP